MYIISTRNQIKKFFVLHWFQAYFILSLQTLERRHVDNVQYACGGSLEQSRYWRGM